MYRCQGKQGYGGEGKGKGANECWSAGDQEIGEEVTRGATYGGAWYGWMLLHDLRDRSS